MTRGEIQGKRNGTEWRHASGDEGETHWALSGMDTPLSDTQIYSVF